MTRKKEARQAMARDVTRQRERAQAHVEMQRMASISQSQREENERLRNDLAELLGRYAIDGDENAVAWLNRIYGRTQVYSLGQLLEQLDAPFAFEIRVEVLQMAIDDVEQQRRSRATNLLSWVNSSGARRKTATPPGRLSDIYNRTSVGLRDSRLPHDAYWYDDLDADNNIELNEGLPVVVRDFARRAQQSSDSESGRVE